MLDVAFVVYEGQMLLWMDVPVWAPQTMAFRVNRVALTRYREALARALGEGDSGGLVELWHEHAATYERAYRSTRVRLETAWLHALFARAEELGAEDETLAEIEATRVWIGGRDRIEMPPEPWRCLVAARGRLMPGFESVHGLYLHMLAAYLREARAEGRAPQRSLREPPRDLSWARAVTHVRDDAGVVRPLSVAGDRYARLVEPPTELLPHYLTPGTAAHKAQLDSAAAPLLELLVGAWQPSRGPGPLSPPPAVTRPLADPERSRLPLFGYDPSATFVDGGFLVGESLDAALEEVREAEPSTAWWSEWDRSQYERLQTPTLRAVGWLSVDDVLPDWPRLRTRFVDLLEEARRADEAVLVTVPPPCDQGPVGGPVVDVVEWLRG